MIDFVSLSVAPADILGWSSQIYSQNHILLIEFSQTKIVISKEKTNKYNMRLAKT